MKIPNLKVITAEERQRSVSIKVEMEYRFFVYETKVNNLPISKDREKFRFISPTIKYMPGHIIKVPYKYDDNHKIRIDTLAEGNIKICKNDWDSFETSWDFKKHPLAVSIKIDVKDTFHRIVVQPDLHITVFLHAF